MTLSQTPRSGPSESDSLADLAGRLHADQRLDARRRRDFLGAIKTICAVLGMPSAAVPAAMSEIDRLLNAVPAPVRGRSKKTIANLRSRLKAALIHSSDVRKLPPHGTALNAAWSALYQDISDLRLRNGLSRLIRIASFWGVPPNEVNDAFLHQALEVVSQINWGRDTKPFWRSTVQVWNEAAETLPHWPQTRLTPPPEVSKTKHLALNDFPVSFQRDVDEYLAWACGRDPLADDGPDRLIKDSTARLRSEQLRLAASTLASILGSPERIQSLRDLVVPKHARSILTRYLDQAHGEYTAFIRGLALTLTVIAQKWVKVPAGDLAEIKRIKGKLKALPHGLTEKNSDLIRKFDDPQIVAALRALPEQLRQQANTGRLSPDRRLQKMQIALAIQILIIAPMRLQNLARLELNRSLQWPSGRAGAVSAVLRRSETKNEVPLEYPLTRAKQLLDEYLDRYRCHVKVTDRDWLFIRRNGNRVPDSALRDGITKAIARGLNIKMTPHQFRHLAAAIALNANPGALELVRSLLGQRSIKTTSHFYAGMRTREAVLEYDRLLERAVPAK